MATSSTSLEPPALFGMTDAPQHHVNAPISSEQAQSTDNRQCEERLRAVLKTAVDAIIIINEHGIIVEANPAAERIFGYPRQELIDQNVGMLMPAPYREEHDQYIARYLNSRQPHIIGIGREVMALRKDGSLFPADLAVSEIDHMRLFTGIVRDISARKRLERKLLEAAAEEQRRIGRDIHDGVGQELTGLGLMAQTLAETLEQDSPHNAALAGRIAESIDRVQHQIRNISRGLTLANLAEGGLPTALQQLATSVTDSGAVECKFLCDDLACQLEPQTATHLFRLAQEAVSNALRHSGAQHLSITLLCGPHRRMLEISDDGRGFDPHTTPNAGMGLRTMHHRAGLIGGVVTVEPREGGGTVVRCLLPEEPLA